MHSSGTSITLKIITCWFIFSFLLTSCKQKIEQIYPSRSTEISSDYAQTIARQIMDEVSLKIDDDLELSLWAADTLVNDPIAISIDDHGRVFYTSAIRQTNSEFDIRSHQNWMTASISFETVEDRRAFLRETFSETNEEGQKFLKDLNQDGQLDWKDLTAEKEQVWFVEDVSGDGLADRAQMYLEDFHQEITDVANGIEVHNGEVFIAVGPDLWRTGDRDKDGPGFQFDGVLSEIVTKGVEFIKEQETDQRPFFLYLPLTAPHTPWLPTEETAGTTNAGKYTDFVKLVDNKIGVLLSLLDEMGLTNNTLIVLSSDNGAHWTLKDKELFAHRPNYIYRGQKADIYEGGHRIPYVVRWPEHVPEGSQSDQLLSTTDFMATMAGVINELVPEGAAPDSHDMSEVILGEKLTRPTRTQMIQHSLSGLFAIRQVKWKYTPVLGSGGFSDPVSIDPQAGGPNGALYDLSIDIAETQNLISQYPDQARLLHQKLEEIAGQEF